MHLLEAGIYSASMCTNWLYSRLGISCLLIKNFHAVCAFRMTPWLCESTPCNLIHVELLAIHTKLPSICLLSALFSCFDSLKFSCYWIHSSFQYHSSEVNHLVHIHMDNVPPTRHMLDTRHVFCELRACPCLYYTPAFIRRRRLKQKYSY